MNETDTNGIREKLRLETSPISWRELQRFFAAGTTIAVDKSLDLIDVALQCSTDNKKHVQGWLQSGRIAKVSDQQALTWYRTDAKVRAVVVKPWVLVQPLEKD